MQNPHNTLYGRTGLILVAVIALAVIALSAKLLSGARVDLTQNNLYTLSDGTRNILGKLDEPINLYFFYSRDLASDIPVVSTYATRVRAMLQEMEQAADGKLNFQEINPEPFSEAEDRAASFGLEGLPLESGDPLYFGIAGSNALDESLTIPFLQPQQEPLLEYELSKLVYQLAQTEKPVLGLISGLQMGGGLNQQTFRPNPEWMMIDQLRQFFELERIEVGATEIPEGVGALMIVHPVGLSEALVYAVDQFLLGGGNALVFLDPFAETAAQSAGDPTADPATPTSELATLLEPLGLNFDADNIVGDGDNALVIGGAGGERNYHLGIIGIAGDSTESGDVLTEGLEQINMAYAGAFTIAEDAPVEITPILASSAESALIPSFRVQPGMDPKGLRAGFSPDGTQRPLAVRIRGVAKSAFGDSAPDGMGSGTHIAESEQPINLIVVGDTDLLRNNLWVNVQNFFGQTVASPFASNGDFVTNAVDNLLGSSDLIGIRARANFQRPFEVVEDLRRRADDQFLDRQQALQAELQATERKIAELQTQGPDGGGDLILTEEQRAEIERFRDEQIRTRRELREVRRSLDRDIEQLGTTLKVINIAAVPALLTVYVLGLALVRRRRRARASQNREGSPA